MITAGTFLGLCVAFRALFGFVIDVRLVQLVLNAMLQLVFAASLTRMSSPVLETKSSPALFILAHHVNLFRITGLAFAALGALPQVWIAEGKAKSLEFL
jgi:hypothetical protein